MMKNKLKLVSLSLVLLCAFTMTSFAQESGDFAWSAETQTVTVTYGDVGEAYYTASADYDTTISYASSDEAVVEVDTNTGLVTIMGAGEATITATATATETYEEASLSYEIVVSKAIATGADFSLHQGLYYVRDDLSEETVVTSETVTNFTVNEINTNVGRNDRSVTVNITDDPNYEDATKLDVGDIEIYSIMGASVSETSDTAYDEGNVNEGRYFITMSQDESLPNTFNVIIIANYAMDEYKRPLTIYAEPWITLYTSFTKDEEPVNVLDIYWSTNPETDDFDAIFDKSDLEDGDDGYRDFIMWYNTENSSLTRYYATSDDGDDMITVNYTFFENDIPYVADDDTDDDTDEDTDADTEEDAEEETSDSIFSDVNESAYYYEALLWAVEEGITTGTTDTTFSPSKSCTRGEAISFLWRMMGEPVVNFLNQFEDIDAEKYYYEAVLWGTSEQITAGKTDTSFAPNDVCTRAEIVTFLYRLAGEPETSGENQFSDVSDTHFAVDAITWASDLGITTGTDEGSFSPEKTCTRGEIVTFLYRYANTL